MDLLDLLITAGGNTDDADLGRVLLIRENKSQIYDLNDLILKSTQGTMEMPKVQNGDSVYVTFMKKAGQEKQEPKKMVRIFGGVKAAGHLRTNRKYELDGYLCSWQREAHTTQIWLK